MEQFEQQMTEEDFEAAVVTYGSDIAIWPEALEQAASAFIATTEGKLAYENARKFDQNMRQIQAEFRGDGEVDAFLARLKSIPGEFVQQQGVAVGGGSGAWSIYSLIDRFFEPARPWSRAGLVSQGVFASALLFAGLMVGANAASTEGFEDYDISAGLFEVSDQDYSIDG